MTTALITISAISLPDAISEAYATRDQAFRFLIDNLPLLSEEQATAARYAYARANYREGRGLFVDALALLNHTTVSKIEHFCQKLFRFEACEETYLTNQQCSQIMSAMMEM